MVALIHTAIGANIQAAPYIERYGGVAIPVTIFTEEGSKTMPVSETVTARDCFDGGKFKKLVPDSAFKSVCWLESQGASRMELAGPKRSVAEITGTARLCVWLNLQKLGQTNSSIQLFELDMAKRIKDPNSFLVGGQTGLLSIGRISIIETASEVFAKYSFNKEDAAFFYPHAAFGLDFEYKINVPLSCLAEIESLAPIHCITEW